jgi:CubicO group peptidase (beta-lactamase class C family)
VNGRIVVGLFVVFSLAIVSGCSRSTGESARARVDQVFAEWNRADSPGCSVGISRKGTVVYERGYGTANLESGAPITPESVFHVASVSKQFTAMSILLLAQRGRLSLDDEVRKFTPDWNDREDHVTIRHLLSHTSGLRDGFSLLGMAAPRADGIDVNGALVRMLARQRATNFEPGTEFQYSNSGYALLAAIVTRVSGQSLRSFTAANIFKPLGMFHTHVHDDPTMIVANRASGYHRDGDGLHAAVHDDLGHLVGTTGVLTTTGDLLRWEQNFADVRVGDSALVAAMETPTIPTGWPDKSSYGFGLEIGAYRGARTIGHAGGDPGYAAYAVRYPDQGLAVAVLCNLDNIGFSVGRLTERVADIYLADVLDASPPDAGAPPPTVSLTAEQLSSKGGLYRDVATDAVGRIFVRGGRLMASPDAGEDNGIALTPVAENRFVIAGTAVVLEFVSPAAGRSQELHVTGDGPKPLVSRRVTPFAPSTMELRAFEGEYARPELAVTYTLAAREPNLVVQIPGRDEIELEPVFADAFAGRTLGVVEFSRDERGVVDGFTVKTGDVRSLRFDRLKPVRISGS